MRSRLFVLNVLFAVTLASCVNMGPEPYGEDIKAPTLTIAEPVGSEGSLEVTFGASLSGGIAKEDCGFYLSLDETFAASEKVRASSIDKSGKFTYARMLNNYDGKWYCKAYASNGRIEITSSVTSYTVKPFSTYVSATVPDFKSNSDGNVALTFRVFAAEGVSLSECGVCYGTDKSRLSIESDHISADSSTGTHTVTITGLKVGQEYFVCSYAREGENVVYSQACSFVVISAPEIKTSSPTQIESSRAVCGGYDIISKGSEITGKGVVWGTSHNPDVEKTYSKSAGSGSEPFSCTLSGLKPVTTYYVRAYAINKVGIGYGEEKSFTTPPVSVTGVELSETSISITEGDSYSLKVTITPSDATDKSVSWSSSNEDVATVDQGIVASLSLGKVTAVKAGSTTITVKTTDGGYKATCSVTVKAKTYPVTGVSLNKTNTTIVIGESETLVATVSPTNATNKNVSWSSSNEGVATVDQNGRVTAKAVGSATIKVTTSDGGYTATCNVTVKKRIENEDGGNEDYDEEVIEW